MQTGQGDYRGSPERFGYEWATYDTILPEHKAQLERWLGSTGLASFDGKSVLDVGCGMGRNSFWVATAGHARTVTAIDVDEGSLGSARKNLAQVPGAQVVKCSVYEIDSKSLGQFDRVICIGVLHHLERPELALAKMWSAVKPGGELILWVYAKDGNELLLPVIQTLRFVGSRTPIALTHWLAKGITWAALPAIRHLPWRTTYYKNLRTLSARNIESIIFDQMLPRIAHYWNRDEISALVAPLGGQAHVEKVQGNSWHVRVTSTRQS